MTNTALGAGAEKAQEIIFISEAHEKFYYKKLKEVRYQDVYHKALCYCLGINDDTRRNANRIYDFKTGCVKTECLHEGWQTSGSVKVVRMAFNLYCNATPSVDDYKDAEEQINECRQYTVEELFCCAYAPYFWQAIQIRYGFDYFLYWILVGCPYGIRKMCMFLVPKNFGIAGSMGILVLNCIVGGLIGGIIVLVRIIVIFTEIIKVIAGHFWTQCPKV